MRMWMINPKLMVSKFIRSEHHEIHMFISNMKAGRSIKGYVKNNLIEPKSLKNRHDDLVKEILRRGFKHNTPLNKKDFNDAISNLQKQDLNKKIDIKKAFKDLEKKGGILSNTSESIIQSFLETTRGNEIIVQNKYYSKGLREQQIDLYYNKNKLKILKEVDGRPILLFLFTDKDKYIVKRNISNKPIVLNNSNYEKIISGRTLSISVEQPIVKYFILDIDAPPRFNENELKTCVSDIVKFLENEQRMVNSIRITNSANGYHIYGYLRKPISHDKAVFILEEKLKKLDDKYYINKKGKPDKINIDLSSMYKRGSHTVPFSLNLNGTVCMDITKKWKTFNRKNAIIS